LNGNYQQAGRRLSISSLLGPTEVDCPPEVEKVEQQFINALELTRSYTREGNRLNLRDESGKLLAYFQAAQFD
jgi:heat shock protein HslJ